MTSDQDKAKTEPRPTSQAKDKKSDKGLASKKMKDKRDRDRSNPYPYKFHKYHPLNTTFEKVFLQIGDKKMFRRPTILKKIQQEKTMVNTFDIIGQ